MVLSLLLSVSSEAQQGRSHSSAKNLTCATAVLFRGGQRLVKTCGGTVGAAILRTHYVACSISTHEVPHVRRIHPCAEASTLEVYDCLRGRAQSETFDNLACSTTTIIIHFDTTAVIARESDPR